MSSADELPAGLVNFFIYNIEYGQREGTEEEKVMFYTPTEVPLGKQINAVGLCQAIAQFVNGFDPSHPCECLITLKTKQYFMNPESSFWMVMTLAIPCSEKVSREKKVLEYHPDNVQDNLGKAILKQTYDMFVLFNGPFEAFVDKHGVEALKEQFKLFYYRYLQTINIRQMDILDVFKGIDYLPLEKVDFLRVQCFVNLVENTFSGIHHVCFLHNENVVWTTLQLDDMKILYKYLKSRLFPASNEMEQGLTRSSPVSTARTSPSTNYNPNFLNPGKFLTAPRDLVSSSPYTRLAPRIFVQLNGKVTELYLVIYKAHNSVMCFLMDSQSANADYCTRIHNFVGPQLGNLSNIISEQHSKRILQTNNQYRFVYFNSMNLAIRTSIHKTKLSNQNSNGVSPEIMKLLIDIHKDIELSKNTSCEIATKMMNDCWVVGKRSGFRQFFVVFNQKNWTIVEICEELQRLMNTGFGNILFLE
ncbi:vacuolar fusion protein CCZ1 homolog [Clytia hemisphaerica]|uniref:Vacuolar fusion protein CCZ1 homolog n=1 Tax=Clytia hemisphaerica TaxID=252671 RepID=A0A7M5TVJ9_9CNID|eukprot:TCONS_00022301-protein